MKNSNSFCWIFYPENARKRRKKGEDREKSLQELESLVSECVSKQLKGHEQDKSDLTAFQANFEQLKIKI